MVEQYVPNLGHEPEPNARRDCIHIAVAPVVAGEELWASNRVYLNKDGEAVQCWIEGTAPIGVVDPFLMGPVLKGKRFWLFLLPGTITSLRHVWSHPAFVAKVPVVGKEVQP